jgi:alpha-L-fucosidase 2
MCSRFCCILSVFVCTLSTSRAVGQEIQNASLSLRYQRPAQNWEREALPIGNGRLGAMIFGGIEQEHLQFNEDSLWIGDEEDTGAYQAFGDIFIELQHPEGNLTDYVRSLDLARGLHEVTYRIGGVTWRRIAFSSYPAQVLVLRLESDQPGQYTGRISMRDAHKAIIEVKNHQITAKGSLAGYVYNHGSTPGRTTPYQIVLDYEARLLVEAEGGTLEDTPDGVAFHDCHSLTLFLAAGTNYVNRREKGWRGDMPGPRLAEQVSHAAAKGYRQLLEEHLADYQGLFNRLSLDLGQLRLKLKPCPWTRG